MKIYNCYSGSPLDPLSPGQWLGTVEADSAEEALAAAVKKEGMEDTTYVEENASRETRETI